MEHVWDVSHCRRCGASLMSVQMGSEPARCGARPDYGPHVEPGFEFLARGVRERYAEQYAEQYAAAKRFHEAGKASGYRGDIELDYSGT